MASSMVEMTLWAPSEQEILVEKNGKSAKVILKGEQIFRFIAPKEHEIEIGRFFEEAGQYNVIRHRYSFASFEALQRAVEWATKTYLM